MFFKSLITAFLLLASVGTFAQETAEEMQAYLKEESSLNKKGYTKVAVGTLVVLPAALALKMERDEVLYYQAGSIETYIKKISNAEIKKLPLYKKFLAKAGGPLVLAITLSSLGLTANGFNDLDKASHLKAKSRFNSPRRDNPKQNQEHSRSDFRSHHEAKTGKKA